MAKNNRYYQTAVHENNSRDRFVRSKIRAWPRGCAPFWLS
jgi:hypothetical protein